MKDRKYMLLEICSINLYLPDSRSLKDKRNVIKNIKLQIRNKFNVSVSEINNYDLWKKATLGIVGIGNEKIYLNNVIKEMIKFIENKINYS